MEITESAGFRKISIVPFSLLDSIPAVFIGAFGTGKG
jgi:hypothetical protein